VAALAPGDVAVNKGVLTWLLRVCLQRRRRHRPVLGLSNLARWVDSPRAVLGLTTAGVVSAAAAVSWTLAHGPGWRHQPPATGLAASTLASDCRGGSLVRVTPPTPGLRPWPFQWFEKVALLHKSGGAVPCRIAGDDTPESCARLLYAHYRGASLTRKHTLRTLP
jgi:hypothetical protein